MPTLISCSQSGLIISWRKETVCRSLLIVLLLGNLPYSLHAQNSDVPAWAYPGSATHVQVAPPPDFHSPSRNLEAPIGIFQGQSDIGSALTPGNASYDAANFSAGAGGAAEKLGDQRDSNPRPSDPQSDALTNCATPAKIYISKLI